MDEDTNKSETGKKRPTTVRLAVVVVLVLVAAGGAGFYLLRKLGSVTHKKVNTDSEVRAVMHLDPFVVNLADPDGDRFLRVGIDLGLQQAQTEHSQGNQNETPLARTRDAILMTLTTCKADNLLAPDGKSKLKEDLIKALREHVPDLGVREVYFTEFLVQR
jgi:flagellar FliL protein